MVDAHPSLRRAATAAALLTAVFGVIVGVGSYFRFPVVSWWFLGILPTPLSALTFACAGVALALFARAQPLDGPAAARVSAIARGLAGIVLVFGLSVVVAAAAGYEVRLDLRLSRIDQFHPYAATSTRPALGLSFFLLGSGLLAIGTKHRGRRVFAHVAISLVALCSLLAVLCALFDRRLFLGHETAGPVSYLASLAILLLCAGYYVLETDVSLLTMLAGNSTGSMVARRLLPAAFIVPPVVGWTSRFAEQQGLYASAVGEAVAALANILVFTALIGWTAQRLLEADAERRKAELSMRESEEQFSEAFEHSPIGVALVSCDGRWLKINPALCELTGYRETELLTKTFFDITHPADRAIDEVERRRLLTGEIRNHQIEKRYLHADGRVLTVIVSVSLIRDEQGQGRYFITQIQDITERKRAEDALRESEARYQRIAANVPGMVYRFIEHADGTRALLFASEGCREIYGVDPQQLQDDPSLVVRLIHPDDRQDYLHSIRLSTKSLGAWNWQGRVRRHDTGAIRSLQGASRPERQANGDVTWDGVVVDVTERQQAEENRRAKEEAERTNLAKSQFLSRMSHELRTPLNAILGFGQLLELNELEADNAQCVDQILKGGRYLLALIDEVLDLSRIEAGELAMKISPVSLQGPTQESVAFVSRMAEARGVTCTLEDSVAWRSPVLADEHRLRQVLLNLLSNAIKYNSEGGQVTLLCERRANARLRLRVHDTGPGISADGLAKLFTPFERLGQEMGKVEGTGLGLAVSKRLIETMGGELGAESQLGRGTTFWIDLPLAVETPLAATERPAGHPALPPASPARSSATLLYIDDNETNLRVISTVVQRLRPEWQLFSARDGRSGLAQVREQHPSVVLLDVQLPGMSGHAVLKELQAHATTRDIPVLMISADVLSHDRTQFQTLGAVDFVGKPFDVAKLLDQLDPYMAEAR